MVNKWQDAAKKIRYNEEIVQNDSDEENLNVSINGKWTCTNMKHSVEVFNPSRALELVPTYPWLHSG